MSAPGIDAVAARVDEPAIAIEVGRFTGAMRIDVADAAVRVFPAIMVIPAAIVAAIVVPVIIPPVARLRIRRKSERGRGQGESEKQ